MPEARWTNALGEEVDLDDIDRVYALNILTLYVANCGVMYAGRAHRFLESDPLVMKLREVVLHGREPNAEDRERARRYNRLNKTLGQRWRAPVA